VWTLTHRLSLAYYTQAISCTSCTEWNTTCTSERFDARRAADSTRFGVVALSLSGTVLGRRASLGYVYGVEHK